MALGPTAVTATFSAVFTDATLTAQGTAIKAVHITDLRSAINTLRTRNGLSAFAYTDATLTPGTTVVKGIHLTELGTALREMGPFTDPAIIRSLQQKNLSLVTKPDLEHLMAAEEKEARERGVPWFKFAEDEAMLKAIEKAKAAMV